MSVANELQRIVNAKKDLAEKAVELDLKFTNEQGEEVAVSVDENGTPNGKIDDIAEALCSLPNNGAKQLFLGLADDKGNWISRQAITKGYHDGNGFAYIDTEIPNPVTPSTDTQTIKPSAGKVLKQVTVNPIPEQFVDTTGIVRDSSSIRFDGPEVLISHGYYPEETTKTMENMHFEATINPLTENGLKEDAYCWVGSVTIHISDELEAALAEI